MSDAIDNARQEILEAVDDSTRELERDDCVAVMTAVRDHLMNCLEAMEEDDAHDARCEKLAMDELDAMPLAIEAEDDHYDGGFPPEAEPVYDEDETW